MFYSYSKVFTYDKCPHRFWHKYINKTKERTMEKISTGNSFHQFAEAFYKDLNKISNEKTKDYFNKISKVVNELNLLDEQAFLSNEVERIFSSNNNNIDRYTEYTVKGVINEYNFIGKIDLLEIINNNSYLIMDFKPLKKSKLTDLRKQLGIYQLLFQQDDKCLIDNNILVGSYFYKSKEYWFEELSVRSINSTKKWITKTIEKLEEDEEFASNASHYNCKFCNFNNSCKYRVL